jgi:hypothetical protein
VIGVYSRPFGSHYSQRKGTAVDEMMRQKSWYSYYSREKIESLNFIETWREMKGE